MNKIVYNSKEYDEIIFVCSANKYRSPALHYLLSQKIDINCSSQGTMSTLKNERTIKSKPSTNKELNSWVKIISNVYVKEKMLLHSQLKYKNEENNLYIFIGDKHLSKYGQNKDNCISISEFIEMSDLPDPLAFVRSQKDTNIIWESIEKIVDSVIIKLIK